MFAFFKRYLHKRSNSQKRRKNSAISSSHKDTRSTSESIPSTNTSQKESKEGINFHYRDGRRYQNEAEISYVLPNDYNELDRVNQQHWALKYLFQCNFHAPVEDQLKKGVFVLDSGCGPATWTFDMANSYPNSKFFGVDASLVFPQNIKPPNVEFTICNIAKETPFADNTFDFIYQRLLLLGLTNEDWDKSIRELYRVLKPGGYIEFVEIDLVGFIDIGPKLDKVQKIITQMLESRNMAPLIMYELKDRLTKAGFVHEKFEKVSVKVNGHDKTGQLAWEDYSQVMLNLRPVIAQTYPEWADQALFEKYVEECGEECIEYNTVCNFGYNIARKLSN